MIREIEIAFMNAQKVNARSYGPGKKFRRVIVKIDNLTIRLNTEDAQRLRDALDGVLSDLAQEAA